MIEKVQKSRAAIEFELVATMRSILCCGVTRAALAKPSELQLTDIVMDPHIYERLQVAAAAIGALRGDDDRPRGFEVLP